MTSYFFVPASKINKIQDFKKFRIDEYIIDFEDAIKASERKELFNQLNELNHSLNYYYRVPLHNLSNDTVLDLTFLNSFIAKGYRKFIFPKITSTLELDEILDEYKSVDLHIILLIETPKLYLELLVKGFKYEGKLTGIAIGSHDFMSVVGGIHTIPNLEVIRQNILYLAKSYNFTAIDFASMNLKNMQSFENEVLDGFKKGYDAKFIIHPKQLEVFNSIQFYSKEEYKTAIKIEKALSKIKNEKEFNPVIIDGIIIEQPHIKRAKKIITYYNKKA